MDAEGSYTAYEHYLDNIEAIKIKINQKVISA